MMASTDDFKCYYTGPGQFPAGNNHALGRYFSYAASNLRGSKLNSSLGEWGKTIVR
jgi:hypothetical protein